jgi:hypothetical protein
MALCQIELCLCADASPPLFTLVPLSWGVGARSMEIVTHLLDHQDAALRFERDVLAQSEINSTQVFALIPLVLETYAIYSVVTYFLKQLVNRTLCTLFFSLLSSAC